MSDYVKKFMEIWSLDKARLAVPPAEVPPDMTLVRIRSVFSLLAAFTAADAAAGNPVSLRLLPGAHPVVPQARLVSPAGPVELWFPAASQCTVVKVNEVEIPPSEDLKGTTCSVTVGDVVEVYRSAKDAEGALLLIEGGPLWNAPAAAPLVSTGCSRTAACAASNEYFSIVRNSVAVIQDELVAFTNLFVGEGAAAPYAASGTSQSEQLEMMEALRFVWNTVRQCRTHFDAKPPPPVVVEAETQWDPWVGLQQQPPPQRATAILSTASTSSLADALLLENRSLRAAPPTQQQSLPPSGSPLPADAEHGSLRRLLLEERVAREAAQQRVAVLTTQLETATKELALLHHQAQRVLTAQCETPTALDLATRYRLQWEMEARRSEELQRRLEQRHTAVLDVSKSANVLIAMKDLYRLMRSMPQLYATGAANGSNCSSSCCCSHRSCGRPPQQPLTDAAQGPLLSWQTQMLEYQERIGRCMEDVLSGLPSSNSSNSISSTLPKYGRTTYEVEQELATLRAEGSVECVTALQSALRDLLVRLGNPSRP